MRDDLSGLLALITVAEKKSFTAAANALRVTPSAVSQTIRAIEERIGVRLLQRTTRSVGLTEAGERFVARVKPAIDEVQEAIESLNELRDRPSGTLRLNVSRFSAQQFLQPILPAFLAAYPELRLDIAIDDAFVDIIGQGFDAGIRLGETLEKDMISVRLGGDERIAVVASPGYFKTHPKPKHPRELHEHECINYRQISRGAVYRWEFTENGKDFEIAVDGRLLLNDGELMIQAALDGLGVAYLLESTVRVHLAKKSLVRVLDAFCVPFPGHYLYYPSRTNISRKLQVFVEFVKVRR